MSMSSSSPGPDLQATANAPVQTGADWITQAQALIERIKKAENVHTQQLNDPLTQAVKDELAKLIAPTNNSWINKLKPKELSDIGKRLEADVQQVQSLSQRDHLSGSDVVAHASASCLLRGEHRIGGKWIRSNARLVCSPADVQLVGPDIPELSEEYEFYETSQADRFMASLGSTGMSLSARTEFECFRIISSAGFESRRQSHQVTQSETHGGSTFYSKSHATYIPVAACYLNPNKLSREAVDELKKIEAQIMCLADSTEVKSSIRNFFLKYGSHVTCGKVHFGGALVSEASYQCSQAESLEFGKTLVSTALDGYLRLALGVFGGGSLCGSGVDSIAKLNGEFSSQQLSKISMRTKKIGGPMEVNVEKMWRIGLAASNQLWTVLECGQDRLPVWKLITADAFDKAHELAKMLKQVWVTDNPDMTVSEIPSDYVDSVDEYRKFVKEFALMAKESNLECSQWSFQLKQLVQKITAIEKMTRKENQGMAWINETALDGVLIEFFKQSSNLLKSVEANVIHDSLSQIVRLSGRNEFPQKGNLISLIYPEQTNFGYTLFSKEKMENLDQFIVLLQTKFLYDVQKFECRCNNQAARDRMMQTMQTDLVIGVRSLLSSLDNDEKNYLLRFGVCCFLASCGYNQLEGHFTVLFMGSTLQDFVDKFLLANENLKQLQRNTANQEFIQIKLLQIYFECIQNENGKVFEIRTMLLEACKDYWHPRIRAIVDAFLASGCNDMQNMNSSLNAILLEYDENGSKSFVDLNPLSIICATASQSIDLTANSPSHETVIIEAANPIVAALGLLQYWPGKLTLQDVMCLGDESEDSQTECVGFKIMKKIIMKNYYFLDSLDGISTQHPASELPDSEDFWSDDQATAVAADTDELCQQSFSDVLLICFLSADFTLKHILAERLFDCKVAIPIVHSTAYGLFLNTWILRGFVLKFADPDLQGHKDLPLDKGSFRVVSIIRVGSSDFSKSKIINKCMSTKTKVFGTTKRHISKQKLFNGTVEAAWMLPSAGDKQILKDAACVLNLRGDSVAHKEQREFLCSVSSCLIVMLPDEEHKEEFTEVMKQLYHDAHELIVMVTSKSLPKCLRDVEETFASTEQKNKITGMKLRNRDGTTKTKSEIAIGLKSALVKSLFKEHCHVPTSSLNQFIEIGLSKRWNIDEKDAQICPAIDSASDIFESLRLNCTGSLAQFKSQLLPLQAEPCAQIAKLQKQKFRLNRNMVGEEKIRWVSEMDRDIRTARQTQKMHLTEQISKDSHFMQKFLECLQLTSTCGLNGADAFLRHLAIKLNSLSYEKLPAIRSELHQIWDEILKQGDHVEIDLKNRFNSADIELQNGSFGMEHVIREVSQIYQVIKCDASLFETYKDLADNLAFIVAKLLLRGHAIEIIDGDSSSVPTDWLEAVFDQVENIVGKSNLLVLSVLGLQSSGKSTLLNTMFGLQFPVSAGRCTRGAFLQLVRNQPDKSGLNVDYVAVLDTEGLGSSELGSKLKEHDNELATMAIGLADVAIINIYGESLVGIKDVLEIVVHAFIRMKMAFKSVLLRKGCLFIHQNVTAVNAKENNRYSSTLLISDLNEKVAVAAKLEGVNDVRSFSDIIAFDPKEDVLHWPSLEEGSPPNAPINPEYSRNAQLTRTKVLKMLSDFQDSKLSFKNFGIRIRDLWNAVLKEDFVFSFQNTLELKAYREVEKCYGDLVFGLEFELTNWIMTVGVVKLRESQTHDELEAYLDGAEQMLNGFLIDKYHTAESKLRDFFKEHELEPISKKWEQSNLNRLKNYSHRLKDECLGRLRKQKIILIDCLDNEEKMKKYQLDILKQAQQLAEDLRGLQASDEEIQNKFDEMWNKFFGLVRRQTSDWKGVEEAAEQAVRNEFSNSSSLVEEEIRSIKSFIDGKRDQKFYSLSLYNTLNRSQVLDEHFQYEKRLLSLKSKSTEKCIERVLTVSNKALVKIDTLIYEKSTQPMRHMVSKSDFAHIVKLVTNEISVYNEKGLKGKQKPSVTINLSFTVRLAVHACSRALTIFKNWHDEHEQTEGIAAKLNKFKKTAYKNFYNRLRMAQEEVIAADLFASVVERAMNKCTMEKKSLRSLRAVYGDFELTKLHLITQIMESLIDGNNFHSFMSYISDSKEYARKWLQVYVNSKLFTKMSSGRTRYQEMIEEMVNANIESLKNAIHQATVAVEERAVCAPEEILLLRVWKEQFCFADKTLGFRIEDFDLMDNNNVCNILHFESLLLKRLEEIATETINGHLVQNPDEINWNGESPADSLLKRLWGCPEKCPFCLEPCLNSTEGHYNEKWSHLCIQHRPAGVTGTRSNQYENKLALSSCHFDVQSSQNFNCGAVNYVCRKSGLCEFGSNTLKYEFHKYKDYKTLFPDWQISPDASNTTSKYWMWFMGRFADDLAKHFDSDPLDLPENWRHISAADAKKSLSVYQPSM